MMKLMKLLSILLGVGAIIMFLLAGTLDLRVGWAVGLGMLLVAAAVALLIALLEGGEDAMLERDKRQYPGSFRHPRT
jgi:hypothetical protein